MDIDKLDITPAPEKKPDTKIYKLSSIQTVGYRVRLTSNWIDTATNETGTSFEDLTRREALTRAFGIVGLDKSAQDLVEAIIRAANQARINELGQPYDSKQMELLLKTAAAQSRNT